MAAPQSEPATSLQCPEGFLAAAATCGIKPSGKPDLAVIACPDGASAAAVFTTNLVRAAPLQISATNLEASKGRIRGIMINSGCANAATGTEGHRRAQRSVDALASRLKCSPHEILINSTGVIGVQLADEKIINSLDATAAKLSRDGLGVAAEAIMTTDTCSKIAMARIEPSAMNSKAITMVGIAKGSGMIHPNMATMIAVLMTDAAVEPPALDRMLRTAVDRSFHRITVDGDTSTNDSVFLLASGKTGRCDEKLLTDSIAHVARQLAIMVVRDGEGAKKLVHVRVTGAAETSHALQVAQTVASSLLVRTAIAGGDPNWGRILAAIGRSGAPVQIDRVQVDADGVRIFENGAPTSPPADQLNRVFIGPDVAIDINLNMGDESDEFFTCDLTEGYIRINADYTT